MHKGIVIIGKSGNAYFIPLLESQMEADVERLLREYIWTQYIIVTYDEVIRKEG